MTVQKINSSIELANSFYKTFHMRIFNDVFYVLIDKLHANGFENQMKILRTLIQVLDHVLFDKSAWRQIEG